MSSRDKTTVAQEITELLAEHYDFEIPFSLLTADEYRKDAHNLPEWWNEDMPRQDAMFFTTDADRDALTAELENAGCSRRGTSHRNLRRLLRQLQHPRL